MIRACVRGVGFYSPPTIVYNDFFSEKYGRDLNTFLVEKRNIRERRFMRNDQATSDLAIPAAKEAMRAANVTANDLDLIIVATDTPDQLSPSTASVVQNGLQARRAGTFDLNAACSGFVTALDVASKYVVADERYRTILVIGAYGMSKFIDWDDYKSASVFADGAGAVVVQRSEDETGVLASHLITEGEYHDAMGIYAGGTREPVTAAAIAERRHLLQFKRRIPPELNAVAWPRLAHTLCDRIGVRVRDIDHFFFTQINVNSIKESMLSLGVPFSKAHLIMDRYGYTGSACIPMAIGDAACAHKLKKDDLVLLLGSGGGVTMAAMALRWSYET